jgi:hypothetical protein
VVETSLLVFTPLGQTSLSDSIIKSAQEPDQKMLLVNLNGALSAGQRHA